MFKGIKTAIAVALSIGGLGTAVTLSAVAATPKEEKIVEATGTTTLYINQFDGGGSWSNFSYYLFGGSAGEKTAWPGDPFTDAMKTKTPNEYDQYQYVLEIDTSKYPKLILVGRPSSWSGEAQTEDLVIADMPNNGLYCGSQIPNTNKFNVGYYTYSTKTVYLHDLKGDVYNSKHFVHTWANGKSGTSWPGVEMELVSGTNNIYSAEINSALQNVIFNNHGSNQTATISNVVDKDTFIVYPDNGYNKTSIDAAKFIDKYMKFETNWLDDEGTGQCKTSGWYTSAKTAFESLSSDVKTQVLEHEPTKYRLEAWAEANGGSFNISTGVFSSNNIKITTNKPNYTLIILLIGVLGITSLGAFFLLRKKRKQY